MTVTKNVGLSTPADGATGFAVNSDYVLVLDSDVGFDTTVLGPIGTNFSNIHTPGASGGIFDGTAPPGAPAIFSYFFTGTAVLSLGDTRLALTFQPIEGWRPNADYTNDLMIEVRESDFNLTRFGDALNSGDGSLDFQTANAPIALSIVTTLLQDAAAGVAYPLTPSDDGSIVNARGGSAQGYTWTIVFGALPTGIAFANDDDGDRTPGVRLSGIPPGNSVDGVYVFRVRVTDSLGAFVERTLSIRVTGGTGDTTVVTLFSQNPAHGAVGWDPTTPIEMVWDSSTVAFNTALTNYGGGTLGDLIANGVAASGWTLVQTLSNGNLRLTLTLIPTADWAPNTLYTDAELGEVIVVRTGAGDGFLYFPFEFTTGDSLETDPPYVTAQDPAPDETSVDIASSIEFRVADDGSGIDLATLNAYVRQGSFPPVAAVVGGVLQAAFAGAGSGVTAVGDDFDVVLVPLVPLVDEAVIYLSVQVSDLDANAGTFAWSFDTIDPVEPIAAIPITGNPDFPLSMYRFIIFEIRRKDQIEGARFLERFFQGPNTVWQDTVRRLQSIPNVWNVNEVESRLLPYVKNIVGWTDVGIFKRITDALDDVTLRRLISVSGALWRNRGTETALLDVLQVLTAARARIWNWFDFRWVLGETGLSEEREGNDPWVINLPSTLIDVGPPATYTTDERLSNLRIVDDGNLNRDLVRRIVRLMRATGERFEITYLRFLDLFLIPDDATQWDLPAGLELIVADGHLQLIDETIAQSTFAIVEGSYAWAQYVFTARIRGRSEASNAYFGVMFYRSDDVNFYEVVIDTVDQELRLQKRVANVLTSIATVNLGTALINMLADVWYALRVSVVEEGATNRIIVFVDGATLISTTDPDLAGGSVGIRHDVDAVIEIDEAEVIALPSDTETLEINSEV